MAGAPALDHTERVQADSVIAARLRAGDEAALAEIYDRFAPTVLGVARRVTGDPHAAEEAVQEAFLWVWTHPERFDPSRGTLRSWLAVLSYRRAVDWVRTEVSRRRTIPSSRGSWEVASAEEVVLEAHDAQVAEELAATVRSAVDALPAAQRDVVRLLYFEGRRVSDIAATLGVPEGTAKTRLRAARQRLAADLGTEGLVTA
jgi:RNA polymerase sigma-70 factor (ECF subfamily)